MTGFGELSRRQRWLRAFAIRPGKQPESELKRLLVLLFLLIGIPIVFGFGIYHLFFTKNITQCLVLFACAAALSGSLFFIRYLPSPILVYRTITAVFGTCLIITLTLGGAVDSRLLWVFLFPFVPFFLLGKREGLLWNLAVYLIFLTVLSNPGALLGAFQYDSLIQIRFVIAYGIILLITYIAESIIQKYREEVQKDKAKVLSEIEERKRAEEILREAHEGLEIRVQERTAELTRATQELKNEIEERKRIEKALRESEARYRGILDTAPDSITITRMEDGRYLQVNEAFCKLSGYSRQEVLGKTAFELNLFVDEEDRASFINILKETGEIRSLEVRYRAKDGSILNTLFSARTIKYRGEDCIEAVVSDITARKRAEEALRESEEKYRLLVENADEAIFVAQDGVVKFPNPKTLEMVGYSEKELETVPFVELIHPDDREMVLERHNRRLKGEHLPSIYTFRIVHKKGLEIWVQLNTVLINWDGRPATLNFLSDVTKHKELEFQLQQAQKMESIGTIASGVAHNFRNVLAGISLNMQLIEKKYSQSPGVVKATKRVEDAVRKGAQLVEGLMQFSRGEGKKNAEIINLADVVHEIGNLIKQSFDKKIEVDIQVPQSFWIRGDQSALSQVLMNLCTNARDAMPKGGLIRIKGEKRGEKAEISVSDTGEGMDRDTLARCFDPFFTTKESNRGTGLGLSTSYGTIVDHDGDIKVSSEPGKGTTFKIVLPLLTEVGHVPRSTPGEIKAGKGQKILIVDDEAELLRPLEELIQGLGYNTASAMSGKAAIKKFTSWRPDAVLMDRNMPQMDGISCAKAIFEEAPRAKIVLISGYEENGPDGIDPEIAELISAYVTKPVDVFELSELLATVLDN